MPANGIFVYREVEQAMIAVINYGMGNVASIVNMLKKAGHDVTLASTRKELDSAQKLVLPGVGAFDNAMRRLTSLGLVEALHAKVMEDRTPILGICLGVQLFLRRSEEGSLAGFGWIDGEARRFTGKYESGIFPVPHMGWNTVRPAQRDSLFRNISDDECRFYFVHSYHLACGNPEDVLGTTDYGVSFVSAVERANIVGVQFHPEKSHRYGMKLLNNFALL
jgi:imidazole glycerol-phosphate synthase subunit HisH